MTPSKPRSPMPLQPPAERIKNFNEVTLGYDEETAVSEAKRCLQCAKHPCVEGCPVGIEIPRFVKSVADRDFRTAANIIKEKNSLPAICGRVCPQEEQCESCCVLGKKGEPLAIGRLERFVADWEAAHPDKETEKKESSSSVKGHVAVIGSGPAGLTAAADLARMGHRVVIFEAFHKPGGVLVYGIPEFRLPKRIVEREVEYVKGLGVEIRLDQVVGRIVDVDELLHEKGFDAVFVAVGAGLPKFMDIPGENLIGVYTANELLTRSNLMKAYLFPQTATPIEIGRRVAVIGGGNVAMDAARTARRLGAERVVILYRRTREEMPARSEEVDHAIEEGIEFQYLTVPIRIIGDESGSVKGIECARMVLGEPDDSGRRRPVRVEGSNFTLELETVVVAIGSGANPLLTSTIQGIGLNQQGYIVVDPETGLTNKAGVFAGGDIVTGSATVISAMAAGKRTALAIDEYLNNK